MSEKEETASEKEDDGEISVDFWPNIGKLRVFVGSNGRLMFLGILFASIDAIATTLQSSLVGSIVDTFGGVVDSLVYERFKDLLVQLSVTYVIEAIFAFLVAYSFKLAGTQRLLALIFSTSFNGTTIFALGHRIAISLQERVFASLVRKEISFFDASRTGELSSRLSSTCPTIGASVASLFPDAFLALGLSIMNIGSLVYISWRLTLALVFTLPFVGAAMYFQGRVEQSNEKSRTDLSDDSNQKSIEVMNHIRSVRLFGKGDYEIGEYSRIIRRLDPLSHRIALIQSLSSTWVVFAMNICILVVFWVGGKSVFNGSLSGGQIISFSLYALSLTEQVGLLPDIISRFNRLLVLVDKTARLIDEANAPVLSSSNETIPLPNPIKGNIVFQDIVFAYPGRPDKLALNKFSLSIPSGSRTAILGRTGSGKSTTVGILARLYEFEQGRVTLDGVDIRKFDATELRSHFAVITQDPAIFSGTIKQNIAYGLPESRLRQLTPEQLENRIETAAKAANAHDFIMLRGGYDVLIGERGANLSGGERQRLAIARALIRNPSILIADEATSALDASTERDVQDALDRLMQGRTCIIITHRLTTVQKATHIAVLDNGAIVESGTHDELLQKKGHYWSLFQNSNSID